MIYDRNVLRFDDSGFSEYWTNRNKDSFSCSLNCQFLIKRWILNFIGWSYNNDRNNDLETKIPLKN